VQHAGDKTIARAGGIDALDAETNHHALEVGGEIDTAGRSQGDHQEFQPVVPQLPPCRGRIVGAGQEPEFLVADLHDLRLGHGQA
jgi:hypothetical protein